MFDLIFSEIFVTRILFSQFCFLCCDYNLFVHQELQKFQQNERQQIHIERMLFVRGLFTNISFERITNVFESK